MSKTSQFPSDLQHLLKTEQELNNPNKIAFKIEEILTEITDVQSGINLIDADIKTSNTNDAVTIDIINQLVTNNNELTKKVISLETKLNQYIMLRDFSIWTRIKYIFAGRV